MKGQEVLGLRTSEHIGLWSKAQELTHLSYPGISCGELIDVLERPNDLSGTTDIPSHAYQYTFENNPNWSRFYAPGSEILEYLKHVVDKYGARKYMKFQHEFKGARWCKDTGNWDVELLRLTDGQVCSTSGVHSGEANSR
jgi:hypothetical protein